MPKMAEFRAHRSDCERMLHLRARTFALLTGRRGLGAENVGKSSGRCVKLRFLATFDDQATRRAVAATAWNNRLTEGQINRLRTKTPDVGQGQIALLDQRLLPAA